MHNPLFFISLPENSIADYPHNTLLPQKENNAAESFSFKAKAKAFRGQINECGRHSKARLTMLRNSNFRPVFQNAPIFTTTPPLYYTQRLEAQPTLISQV